MAGARPEADIENGPGREHCKLNALHQAERARKFAEQELRGEGGRQNQRNAIGPSALSVMANPRVMFAA
jgi:hypothetical protein